MASMNKRQDGDEGQVTPVSETGTSSSNITDLATSATPPPEDGDVPEGGGENRTTGEDSNSGNPPNSSTAVTGTSAIDATESTGTTSPTGSPPPPSLSVGEAVGVGIGSAIAGALIALAFALACFYWKRRRRGPRSTTNDSEERRNHVSVEQIALDQLAEPLGHETIRRDMGTLRTGIKNCVDNYFSLKQHPVFDAGEEERLQALAGRPSEVPRWSDALGDPDLRPLVVREIMARAFFAMIDPRSAGNITLLPPHLKGAYQGLLAGMNPTDRGRSNTSQKRHLLSMWRQISGHLLSNQDRPDQGLVRAVTAELATALAPLRPRQSGNYHSSLQNLVASTAKLGIDLFEQPQEWQAVWTASSSYHDDAGAVTVFPGLVFLYQEQATSKGQGSRRMRTVKVCDAVRED